MKMSLEPGLESSDSASHEYCRSRKVEFSIERRDESRRCRHECLRHIVREILERNAYFNAYALVCGRPPGRPDREERLISNEPAGPGGPAQTRGSAPLEFCGHA